MPEYIEKEYLRGWTLIAPQTPSGKLIPYSVDDIPSAKIEDPVVRQWNWCHESPPPEDEYVQLLCLDEHGDTPWTYTTFGWRIDKYWIVENNLCGDQVVAWQYPMNPLSAALVKEKLKKK